MSIRSQVLHHATATVAWWDRAPPCTGAAPRASRAPFALASALRELGEATARPLAALERFETADAEEIVVAVGAAFEVSRKIARELRAGGRRAGAIGVRALR